MRPAAIIKEFDLRNLPKKWEVNFSERRHHMGILEEDLKLPWEEVEEKAVQLIEASKNSNNTIYGEELFGGLDFGTSGARISIINSQKELKYTHSVDYKYGFNDPNSWVIPAKSFK